MVEQTWKIYETQTGKVLLESNDPKKVAEKLKALEAKNPAMFAYSVEGDPHKLGLAQSYDAEGNLVEGPEKLPE